MIFQGSDGPCRGVLGMGQEFSGCTRCGIAPTDDIDRYMLNDVSAFESAYMLKTTTWNIHQPDGHYLGQSTAFAAHTAFCRYISVTGTEVAECDVTFEPVDGGAGRVTYGNEEFVLTPQI